MEKGAIIMEQIPDHPVIRSMERTGYPPVRHRRRAGRRWAESEKEDDDGKELYGDPARLP